MAVLVVGVNHRTVPLDLLGRLTVAEEDLAKAVTDVATSDFVSEAVVLSTCNRTEVYVESDRFHDTYAVLRRFLARHAHVAPEVIADHLVMHHDLDAVRHLFEVTAGIDSVVLGETEILGQVKHAWACARHEGAAGPLLNDVFRQAVEVGKRARTETAIARHVASASTAAVAMATERLGSLDGRSALVVGAGEMGGGLVAALADSGLAELCIANRTPSRAAALADRHDAAIVPFFDVPRALGEVDVLFTSTGAAGTLLGEDDLAEAVAARAGRPLLIVDLAVPRDVDPTVSRLDGVTLLDMDDLGRFAAQGIERRRGEVAAVRLIVEDELVRHRATTTARGVAPIITELHRRGEALRNAELARFSGALEGLDDRQRAAVDAVTRGIIAKVLHTPTVTLKRQAGTARGDRLVAALTDLYGLDADADALAPIVAGTAVDAPVDTTGDVGRDGSPAPDTTPPRTSSDNPTNG